MQPVGFDPLPRHVLVVERDMIVGLGLCEDLEERGCRVSGPFISASDVLPVLLQDPPDAAIIDVSLRDGTGPEAARAVQARGIPFVVFSAGNRLGHVAGEFKRAPWVEKPASTDRILEVLLVGPDAAAGPRSVRPTMV